MRAVGLDCVQAFVDLFEQLRVALLHRKSILFRHERGIADRFELRRRVVDDVVLHHAVVGHDGGHAPCGQFLQGQRCGLEAPDIGVGLAQQLLHHLVAGGAGLHADLERLQVVEPGNLGVFLDRDELNRVEIRPGKIHRLLAFVGDGHAGGHDVALAGIQRLENALPGRVDELHLKAALGRNGLQQIHREAFHFVGGRHLLEWRVRRIGAHGVGFHDRCRRGRRSGRRCRSGLLLAAGGQGNYGERGGQQGAAAGSVGTEHVQVFLQWK